MTRTALITTILIITLAIYDLCIVVIGGTESSVSQFLIHIGFHSPVFVFGTGFVCGHVWGWMRPVDIDRL